MRDFVLHLMYAIPVKSLCMRFHEIVFAVSFFPKSGSVSYIDCGRESVIFWACLELADSSDSIVIVKVLLSLDTEMWFRSLSRYFTHFFENVHPSTIVIRDVAIEVEVPSSLTIWSTYRLGALEVYWVLGVGFMLKTRCL